MAVIVKDSHYDGTYSQDMERRQITKCEVLDCVEKKGEDTILSLIRYLLSDNRTEDIKRVTEDVAYKNKLLAEMSEAKFRF